MKRIIAVLLLIALSFSMLACAAPAPAEAAPTAEPVPSKADLLYEKYSGILDALEEEDYQGAIAQINDLIPPPEYEEIVITPENFWDYFEYQEDFYKKQNAFNEVQTNYETIGYGFALKDEYKAQLAEPSLLAIKYSADSFFETANIDGHSFEWTGKIDQEEREEESINLLCDPDLAELAGYFYALISMPDVKFKRLSEIQILRTEGSLFLKK